jgi:hypothetical protein
VIEQWICREIATSSACGFLPSARLCPLPSQTRPRNPYCKPRCGEAIPMRGPMRSASRHDHSVPRSANVTRRASLSSSPISIDRGRIRIPGWVESGKSESGQRVMPYWHHPSVGLVLMQQFSISAFGHPLGARQMSGVKLAASFRVEISIQSEEDLHGLAPICSVSIRVQDSQIERHMLAIIGRELLALRRFIQEWRCRAPHQCLP